MYPEAVPLANLILHVRAQLDVHVGFDNEIQVDLYRCDGDPIGLVDQRLVNKLYPVGFLFQHFLVFVHQLFHAGLGFRLVLGAENLVKRGAHIFGSQRFLQLFDGIFHAVYIYRRQLFLIAVDLVQNRLDVLPLGLQLFHFSAQLVDLSDRVLNTRVRRRAGKIFPLLDIFFTNCINLGPDRHIGIILYVDGSRHIDVFQNRDDEIPFPSVLNVDIKAQRNLLLKAGGQLNLQGICFTG